MKGEDKITSINIINELGFILLTCNDDIYG